MDNSMMNGMMTICMLASTLFALAILVAVGIQPVVQVKLLQEVRKLHTAAGPADRIDLSSRK